LISSIFAG